jgi:hypothetical protein
MIRFQLKNCPGIFVGLYSEKTGIYFAIDNAQNCRPAGGMGNMGNLEEKRFGAD